MYKRIYGSLFAAAAISASASVSMNAAFAEESADTMIIEEVVVTGSRGKPRAVIDSAVPIDVFSSSAIDAVSHSDTQNILQTLVPSYNVARQPISDGSTFVRPATLRGLPSDKTLVLVNSKRRHRAALVVIGTSGTQGPDVATIPSAALKNIEVLRDGASSQYGSDAIAGVINFILKDNSEGFSVSYDTGQYFDDDGFQTTLQGNVGLPLGENGFLSISGEYQNSDFTERAAQYCESWFCLDTSSPQYNPAASYNTFLNDPTFMAGIASASVEGDVVQPWGQPNTETARLFYNSGITLNNGVELYSFGNYSQYEGDGSFFYRYPGNGTIEDLRNEDGSIYNPLEKFPGGFTPRFNGEITDYSFLAGVRGEFGDTGSYDVSVRYGYNEIEYTLENTINPSLGAASPTSFRPGDLTNAEFQLQVDLVQEFDMGLYSPVTFGYGLSYLDEEYEVVAGEEASYIPGPHAESDPFGFCNAGAATAVGLAVIANGSTLDCADPSDPAFRVVGVGSNGFPGYSPEFSDTYARDSYAAYLDLSADITESLFLQGAIRFEDYSDFGNELVGKVAGRFAINERWAIRSSIGTGFRAPTPGQQGTTNVSTRLPNGFPVATGLFPATGPVAQALGAQDLKPETSVNYTLGMTADLDFMTVTVDLYRIDIEDRLYAISTLPVSTEPASGAGFDNYTALVNAGVVGAESIGGVFYFTNAFDSKTQGIDVVATIPYEWDNGHVTSIVASLNYNKSELDSDASAFLNAEDQADFENRDPNWRSVLTVAHTVGGFTIMGRASYFGESEDADTSPPGSVQKFDAKTFVDLEASYQVNDNLRLTLGGRNIFDTFPDKVDRAVNGNDYCCGRVYQSTTVLPWQGGYYFFRANVDF